MIHHFPFEPREVLGISAEATVDEIRDAFREKSKKHHPDLGGDEWAFRMVLRAYEVLKSTAGGPLNGPSAEAPAWPRPDTASGFFSQGRFPFGAGAWAGAAAATATEDEPQVEPEPEPEPEPRPQAGAPGVFQQVEVELIWIRFAMTGPPSEAAEGSTLSVCMVVSWPLRSLVARTAEYANLGETLRHVIDAFDEVRKSGPLAVRSRIEDGQFVGWLSFPDVLTAQSAFLILRDGLARHDLTVHLQTRDEIIPESWAG